MTMTAESLKSRFPLLLERLSPGEVGNLLNALTQIQASPGEELHRHGDQADSLYLVWEGSLLLSMAFDGREIPLGTLGPGQHIGSVAVIEPGSAPTTVTVAEPGTLLRLDHSGLNALRADHPRVGGHLVQALSLDLAERLRFYEEGMTGRNQPPRDPEEFARLCRPLMGIKTG